MPAAAATTRHDPQAAQVGLRGGGGGGSAHESLLLRVETERSPPRPNTVAMLILATRHGSSPTPPTDCRDLQGLSMGGTGLEPVTPSLSIRGGRSRQCAGVRLDGMVERNPSGE